MSYDAAKDGNIVKRGREEEGYWNYGRTCEESAKG